MAYPALSGNEDCHLQEFNRQNMFAEYSRCDASHMDYAFLPCSTQFIYEHNTQRIELLGDHEFENLNNLGCRLEDLVSGTNVWKRGIATGLTGGRLLNLAADGRVFKVGAEHHQFSGPGDSGAVLFAEAENGKLFPVGLHYSGDGIHSYSVPLSRILESLCVKNNIPEIFIKFLHPAMKGSYKHTRVSSSAAGAATTSTGAEITGIAAAGAASTSATSGRRPQT